jgi:O-antigen ligase
VSGARTLAAVFDRVGYVLLLACVIWLPLPLGGNRPLFWSATQAAVFVLVLLASATAVLGGTSVALSDRTGRRILWILACWVGYVFLQALSLPQGWLAILNPGAQELYASAVAVAASDPPWTISVFPEATRIEGMKYASYIGLTCAVLGFVRTRGRLRVLAVTLFAIGVLEALFGIWSASTGFRLYPERWLDGHFDVVTGTFVNRNHFAAHLAMALAIGIGLLLHALARSIHENEGGWLNRVRALAGFALSAHGVFLFGSAIIAAGLFASVSRGGVIAFVSALFVIGGLVLAFRGANSMEGRWLPLVFPLFIIAVVLFGATGVFGRVLQSGADLGGRVAQWRLTLDMVPDYWLFGIGAGAYGSVFPAYRDGSLPFATFDHAHNDYLELLVEQGLIGAGLVGVAMVLAGRRILAALLERRNRFMRGVLFGVAVGMGAMLVHALVEFNFRIPANAGWFFVLLGMGLVAATLDKENHERRK